MKSPIPTVQRKVVLTLFVLLVTATATAIAHVWTHLRSIEYGYRISKATQLQHELLERNRQLHIELAMLKDPARVARLARERLGLRPPEPEQMRRLWDPVASNSPSDSSSDAHSMVRVWRGLPSGPERPRADDVGPGAVKSGGILTAQAGERWPWRPVRARQRELDSQRPAQKASGEHRNR